MEIRCGQRTVRMALWHAAKSNAVFSAWAHLSKSRTETCELVKVKQKLLEIRAELERKREAAKENARGARAGVIF
ncbi:hypothetical protein TNCV_1697081 [Trichonephila clavipes]|nr:hypothetical protein TNCV_1697081 [Trichonephila clavipes]